MFPARLTVETQHAHPQSPTHRVAVALVLGLVLTGCGVRGADSGDTGHGGAFGVGSIGGGETNSGGTTTFSSEPACQIDAMREWVHESMSDYYLFYDQLPAVNLNNYNQADTVEALSALTRDLRVQPFDRYSYVADEAQSSAFFEEGKEFGYGMRLTRTSNNDLRFSLILSGSPMDVAGVQRGDRLIAIDGVDINDITTIEQQNALLGSGTTVVTPNFTIETGSGERKNIPVTKAEFTIETVVATDVINDGNSRIGYLHLLSFLETSVAEIDTAMATLKQQDVNELVLDLRFNGGGRISVANHLASLIVGNAASGHDFARISFSDRYAASNTALPFNTTTNALNLSRVFVLTTDRTCSASEMVINGLRPFIDVITVGSQSCGKPYGTRANPRCGVVLNALEVEFLNDAGTGQYYDGIAADCPAQDGNLAALGTSGEALFASAQGYINTGSCQLVAHRSSAHSAGNDATIDPSNPLLDEVRGLLNNASR